MKKAKFNPMTGNIWVPEGEGWDVWNADEVEITYEPMPKDHKV